MLLLNLVIVFFGEIPEKISFLSSKPTKYIDELQINKINNSDLDEIWFDNNIQINPGLVAIIGNKGSGKSALLDILALLGIFIKQEYFPFLNPTHFCLPTANKAKHFIATLKWKKGEPIIASLNTDLSETSIVERVKYIPQNYFENICNEITAESETEFDRELQQVIYSHVSQAKRLRI